MADDRPFDADDFERVLRGASEEIRGLLGKAGGFLDQSVLNSLFGQFTGPQHAPEPETTGDTGGGVWAIYTIDEDGQARVDQVFPSELEALRAHRDNTDEHRRVRFLPYGVPVSVLDAP
ncbi:hypothetical protein [Nocardia sp. NPDC050413]|uniref:hypothetical protein n=1 Tax=Nocardia sp. NPDC050413 TaxID=3155784 RepID=UPI0033ECC532